MHIFICSAKLLALSDGRETWLAATTAASDSCSNGSCTGGRSASAAACSTVVDFLSRLSRADRSRYQYCGHFGPLELLPPQPALVLRFRLQCLCSLECSARGGCEPELCKAWYLDSWKRDLPFVTQSRNTLVDVVKNENGAMSSHNASKPVTSANWIEWGNHRQWKKSECQVAPSKRLML